MTAKLSATNRFIETTDDIRTRADRERIEDAIDAVESCAWPTAAVFVRVAYACHISRSLLEAAYDRRNAFRREANGFDF